MSKEQKTDKDALKTKMDGMIHLIYTETKNFPKDELYGITSQLRRASLSIILNYIEGYARIGGKEHKRFLQISYGSLKETKYLLFFSVREKYMTMEKYQKIIALSEEVGAMLWKKIKTLKTSNDL